MTESYLTILLESLEKKKKVLNAIIKLEKEQLEIALSPEVNFEVYDKSVDEKGKLIDELNKLDEGFATTYELVQKELQQNPKLHEDIVNQLKALIREITDLTVEVQAQEKRNKDAITLAIGRRRNELKSKHISTNAALNYYKSMSRINTVDPQLMDRKK